MLSKVLVVYSGKIGIGGANVFLEDLLKNLCRITKAQLYLLNMWLRKGHLNLRLSVVRGYYDDRGSFYEYTLFKYCVPFAEYRHNSIEDVTKFIISLFKLLRPDTLIINSVDMLILCAFKKLLNNARRCYLIVHDGGFFCPLKHMWDPIKGLPCDMPCLRLGEVPEYCVTAALLLKMGYMQPVINVIKSRYLKLMKNIGEKIAKHFSKLWECSRKVLEYSEVITPSVFMADLVKKFSCTNPIVIRHGAPAELFSLAEESRVHYNCVRIGFVGDISLHKGIHVLLDAIHLVLDELSHLRERLRFYMIGNVHFMSATSVGLIAKYRNLVGKYVHLVAATRSRIRVYRLIDVLVLPSICHESASLTVVEGIASGKYVIASHVGGVPEYLGKYPKGLLVEPGNANVLADAIAYTIDRIFTERSEIICTRKYVNSLDNVIKEYIHLIFGTSNE